LALDGRKEQRETARLEDGGVQGLGRDDGAFAGLAAAVQEDLVRRRGEEFALPEIGREPWASRMPDGSRARRRAAVGSMGRVDYGRRCLEQVELHACNASRSL
jgi:hypothetical protein